MKKLLFLALATIALTSCDNETPQFKDMQNWQDQLAPIVVPDIPGAPTTPPSVPGVPVDSETDFFQVTTFGEYAETANFDITASYIDDDKSMIAISYTDNVSEFHIYINLETEKYMLVWGTMPLANEWGDAFFNYQGTIEITAEYVKLNISNPTVNIQAQTYKDLQVTNLID